MVIRMKKEEEKTNKEDVLETRQKAVQALVEYLDTFYPESVSSDSKHALMGPVGKLLSRITNTGDINWGAVKGYVLSVHKNQQKGRGVSAQSAEKLESAVKYLSVLKDSLPPTKWLRMVEDLDDEVYFSVYKTKLVGQREWMQKKFHEWLAKEYSNVDEINELLEPDDPRYDNLEAIEDPFSTPAALKDVIDKFWEEYKKKKKEEK